MSVHVIADNRAKLGALSSILAPRFEVVAELLDAVPRPHAAGALEAIVISVDLSIVENISALRALASWLLPIAKRLFVLDQRSRLAVAQAYALGATDVLMSPVRPAQLLAKLAPRNGAGMTGGPAQVPAEEIAGQGAACLKSMFQAVMLGSLVNAEEIRRVGHRIADQVIEHGLTDWLTVVRRHHEGTYQHCLLVTGVAVDFAASLGMARSDIDRLHTAAMFHDLGKAKIPLSVLDKPGKLDEQERALIETHPAAGHEALLGTPGISAEILDAVRHHHEYLDGSGYPDGLTAESISDVVRILTIADIFSALIEHRSYRKPMERAEAYEILSGMRGKLERPLVNAFRAAALER